MASASLSSAGWNPRVRTAAITAALSALPLPAMKRLIVPTGTPWWGMPCCSHHVLSVARKPPEEMRRVRADVAAHLLKIDGCDAGGIRRGAIQPAAEAQVTHRGAEDARVGRSQRPPGRSAEIEREQRGLGEALRGRWLNGSRNRARRQNGGGDNNEGSRSVGLRLWSSATLRRERRGDQAQKFGHLLNIISERCSSFLKRNTQKVPIRTRRSFTRAMPLGLFGSIGLMAEHSWSVSL